MKKPTKLRPRSLDITFCVLPRGEKSCAVCARNAENYDMSNARFVSYFVSPIQKDTPCEYYLEDARKGATE